MLSSSSTFQCSLHPPTISERLSNSNKRSRSITSQKPRWVLPHMPFSLSPSRILEVTFPLAASISILVWSSPAYAGFLSGSTGLESIAGPELPQVDFLNRWKENNQKRYSELDSNFKSSNVLKELLEKSKVNKERNAKEIQDKYCLRGAEWGVGDCSTQGMTDEERDNFIAMLKKKAGD